MQRLDLIVSHKVNGPCAIQIRLQNASQLQACRVLTSNLRYVLLSKEEIRVVCAEVVDRYGICNSKGQRAFSSKMGRQSTTVHKATLLFFTEQDSSSMSPKECEREPPLVKPS